MEKFTGLKYPYWKSFKLPDGVRRWFYTDESLKRVINNKEWFNKATTDISVLKGYETEQYDSTPISEIIYYITIESQILNYFGDTSGMHFKYKEYVLIGDKFYKQIKGEGVEVVKITKELKGILDELNASKT